MWFSIIFLGALSFLLYFIYQSLLTKKSKYWEQYGVRQVDATSAATNFEVFLGKKDVTERDALAYNLLTTSGEKYCGLIENSYNVLLLKDMDLIKKILIKEFEHFPNRRDFFAWAKDDSILKKMLTAMNGDEWKDLRNTLTPAFTTGKIRRMMESFNNVGREWAASLKGQAKANGGSLKIDVIPCVNTYTVDVIASAVFGFKAGTIQNPNSDFATMAGRFSNFPRIKMIFAFQFPQLLKGLGISVMNMEALAWFEQILSPGLQERLSGGRKHNDFLQMLAEAKKGELKAVEEDEMSEFEKEAHDHLKSGKKVLLTNDVMNAQSLLFFLAGFATTTNFITFMLYALAAHQDVQERLRKELGKIAKNDGDFDYDELGQLEYLEMFVCEVLRKFPAANRLERICAKDYKDPETGLTIPKGTLVAIPVTSIHMEPKYYPNPDKFDPEGHFGSEVKKDRSPYAYLPFGSGPRNCIGMRFALIEGKAAVAHIVHHFKVEPTDKTPLPMKGLPGGLQTLPPTDLELKLTPRK